MSTQTAEIPQTVIDTLVAELLDLNVQAEQIKSRQADIRAQLAKLPVGSHTGAGQTFAVRPPNRWLDVTAAFDSLGFDARQECLVPSASLVKRQIPPAQLEAFMRPGDGPNTVVLK